MCASIKSSNGGLICKSQVQENLKFTISLNYDGNYNRNIYISDGNEIMPLW